MVFSSGEALSDIVGHIDGRNRPLVTFSVPGHEDAVLALIDTGFNGYLLMHEDVAGRLGFVNRGLTTTVEFAGHARHRLNVADGRISWFDRLVDVSVLVSSDSPPRAAAPDEPIALIGTALLNPHKLVVDFASGQVLIAEAK